MADEDKVVKAGLEVVFQPVADLIQKIAGPAAEEFGLTLKDHVRVFRMKRQLRLLERTSQILKESGIEPKPVPIKLLKAVLDGGSEEQDDFLQDKWAALLANAAHSSELIHPSYPEILKQLSASDAVFLEAVKKACDDVVQQATEDCEFIPPTVDVIFRDAERMLAYLRGTDVTMEVKIDISVAYTSKHLHRLGLIEESGRADNGILRVDLTTYGQSFFRACHPQKG